MFLSCPGFIQWKNLGILCLWRSHRKIRNHLLLTSASSVATTSELTTIAKALIMFFLTSNAISHHKKTCLTSLSFPVPEFVAPWALRATAGWVSKKFITFRKENLCRRQREAWAVSLFLHILRKMLFFYSPTHITSLWSPNVCGFYTKPIFDII